MSNTYFDISLTIGATSSDLTWSYAGIPAAEENRDQHTREKLEIKQAMRDEGGSSVEMNIVHEMLSHQRQQQGYSPVWAAAHRFCQTGGQCGWSRCGFDHQRVLRPGAFGRQPRQGV